MRMRRRDKGREKGLEARKREKEVKNRCSWNVVAASRVAKG